MSWESVLAESDYQLYRRNIALLEAQVVQKLAAASAAPAILSAIRRVPRHLFVNAGYRALAYTDNALPTCGGLTTSAPSVIAEMIAHTGVASGDRVLEVGTGTGYEAALLAELGCRVVSIEIDLAVAQTAGRLLSFLGYKKGKGAARDVLRPGEVRLFWGNGRFGHPPLGPYNAIIVAASVPRLDAVASLAQQLARSRGTLVVPVGDRHAQVLHILELRGARTTLSVLKDLSFDFIRLVSG